MLTGLLGVETWRTVASWPVSSQTFLYGRLIQPTRRALLISLIFCTPSILVMMIFHGIPVLTGLVMIPICFMVALSVVWSAAAALTIVMGVRPVVKRAVVLLGLLVIGIFPALFQTPLSLELIFQTRYLVFLPTYWLAALPHAMDIGSVGWFGLGVAGIVFWCVMPVLILRRNARWYTTALGRAVVRSERARGAWLARLLTFGSRKPIHFVYGQLILAQARGDWRFQAQLIALPVIFILFSVYMAAGLDLSEMFLSPFIRESATDPAMFFHPAMFFVIAVGIAPILSLPMISQSVDYKARWLLRAGIHKEADFRNASRRYVRLLFSIPVLLLITIGYLVHGVPLPEVAAHVFMLFMITEAMVVIVQTQFPGYPFSLPLQDEEMGINMAVIIVLYEVQCLMMALFVYHVLYRWWWAYAAAVLLFGLLAFRREPAGREAPARTPAA